MKLILEDSDNKVEINDQIKDISDVIKMIKRALIGIGFHPDTIEKGFKEESEK